MFALKFFAFIFLLTNNSHAANSLSYSGRLVQASGAPVNGPVNLRAELVYTNATSTVLCSQSLTGVALTKGVFHLKLDLNCAPKTLTQVLSETPNGESVAMRIIDQTNSKTYPLQAIHSVPFSKVAEQLSQMGANSGQALVWDGAKWAPTSVGTGNGTVTSVTAGTGLSGGTITTTGTIGIAAGGVGTTELANNAVTAAKINAGEITSTHISATANIPYSKLNILDGEIPAVKVGGLAGVVDDILTNIITNGDTTHAPNADVVYDNLVLKFDKAGGALTPGGTITGLPAIPLVGSEATSKDYVDNKVGSLSTTNINEGSNLYFTEPRVLSTALTGVNITESGTIGASDTVLQAFGKTQKQISDISSTIAGNQWTVSGSDVFRATGKVGMGTNDPITKLEVSHTGGATITVKDNNNAIADDALQAYVQGVDSANTVNWYVGEGSSGKLVGLMAANPNYRLFLGTNGVQRLSIDDTGNVGIGLNSPVYPLDLYASNNLSNLENKMLLNSTTIANVGTNQTSYARAANFRVRNQINSGVTQSGYSMGLSVGAMRNDYNTVGDNGTLINLTGARVQYGHEQQTAATPTTTNVYGISLEPYKASGSIDTMYDLFIKNSSGAGGTVNKHYGLYVEGATKENFVQGNLGIGVNAPTQKLDVAGNIQSNDTYFTIKTFSDGWAVGDYQEFVQANQVGGAGSSGVFTITLAGTRGNWTEATTFTTIGSHADSDTWREIPATMVNYYTTNGHRCFTVDANTGSSVVKFRIRAINPSSICSASSTGNFPIYVKAVSEGYNGGWITLSGSGTGATVSGFRTTYGSEWNLYTGASRNAGIQTITAKDGNVGIGTTAPTTTLHVSNLGNNPTGIVNVQSTSSGADGTIAKISPYSFLNANSPGSAFYNWGARFDGETDQWVRSYVAGNNYLPYLSLSSTNKFTVGGAVSNLTTNTNPTLVDYFVVDVSNGNVGIGTSTPQTTLDVNGNVNTPGIGVMRLRNQFNSGGTRYWQIGPDGNGNGNFVVYNEGLAGAYIVHGQTTWSSSSDKRLKKNIEPLTNSLDKLNKLNGVKYHYNKDHDEELKKVGVIAQDVKKVLPEAVTEADGFLSVKYTELIPLTINAIKEFYVEFKMLVSKVLGLEVQVEKHSRAIASIEERNKKLEKENVEMKRRADKLEAENKEVRKALCELGKKAFCR